MKNEFNYESHRDFEEFYASFDDETPIHFHRSIEFMFVKSGEKPYTAGSESGVIKAGELLIVPPLFPHSFHPIQGGGAVKCNVLPAKYSDVWENFLKGKTPASLIVKDLNLAAELEEHLSVINNTSSPVLKDGVYKYVLGRIFQKVKFTDAPKSKTSGFATEVLRYIDENFSDDITLDETAKEFGYSKYYFSSLFNERFKTNFRTYLNNVRIEKAKKMLETLPLSEVAFRSGYKSLQSFFFNFKKVTGITPKEYVRSQNLSE